MAPRLMNRTDRYEELKVRAVQLLDDVGGTAMVQVIRREFGVTISRSLAWQWKHRKPRPATGRPRYTTQPIHHLTPEQERRIDQITARERAKVAALPHRCPRCRGVGPAGPCMWCGAEVA